MIELPTKFRTAEQVAVDIQIQGDHVAVLLNMFHLYVYDWKAGLVKAVCYISAPFIVGSLIRFSRNINLAPGDTYPAFRSFPTKSF